MDKRKLEKIGIVIFSIIILVVMCIGFKENGNDENITVDNKTSYEIDSVPEYNGKIYVEINNNIPQFSADDMNIEEDYYSNLENGKVRNGNDKNLLRKSK